MFAIFVTLPPETVFFVLTNLSTKLKIYGFLPLIPDLLEIRKNILKGDVTIIILRIRQVFVLFTFKINL